MDYEREFSDYKPGDEILEKVANSYGKTLTTLNEDVQIMKEWIKVQTHLPEVMRDKLIQNFLLMNKCKINEAKRTIEMYYRVRSQFNKLFENINPKFPYWDKVYEATYVVALPKLTEDMHRVFVIKVRDVAKFQKVDFYDYLRLIMNLEEVRIAEDVICGDIFIIDAADVPFNTIFRLSPVLFKTAVTLYRDVFSFCMKDAYLINCAPFIETAIATVKLIIKPWVQPKILNRINSFRDSSILLEKFPKEILPIEYGGEKYSLPQLQDALRYKIQKYQSRFDELDNLRIRENLRDI